MLCFLGDFKVATDPDYSDYSDYFNEPSEYIDRIKITCLESGEVFNATVNNDGTWSTNIHIISVSYTHLTLPTKA